MARLNGKGTEEKGPETGRRLGKCYRKDSSDNQFQLGQGMGNGVKQDLSNQKTINTNKIKMKIAVTNKRKQPN